MQAILIRRFGGARLASGALAIIAGLLLASPAASGAEDLANSLGMTLKFIRAGRFEMGERDLARGFYKDHSEFNTAEDDRPDHPVVLTRPLYLAATEVTVGQFRQFVEDARYTTTAESNPLGAVGWDPRPPADQPNFVATFRDGGEFNWQRPGFEQADDHPVVGVSFADAKAFCAWLSQKEGATYRLPTEAEWEYAARAGTQTYFSFGDAYRGQIHRFANIGNVELETAFPDRVRRQWLVDVQSDPPDNHVFTAPAGSYAPSPWGLFDLHGNVWEWCEDRYLDTAYASYTRSGHQQVRKRAIDPLNLQASSAEGDWRVIRGGSWFNAPIQCRSSARGYFEANDAACYLGFRVARDAPEAMLEEAKQRFAQSEAARSTIERLADRVEERRDGRLAVLLSQQRERLAPELLSALEELDEPVDLHVDGAGSLTGEQVAALAKAPRLSGLVLSGIGPNVTDDDLAPLANHAQLELLGLTGAPNLTDALVQYLEGMDRLEFLQIDAQGITDDGLARLPELTRLKTLRVSGGASLGRALARFRGSPLERLSCDHLSDQAAEQLAAFPAIREMSIAGSPITGRGLADIARLPRLEQLDLTGCGALTDADFEALGNVYGLASAQLGRTAAGDRAVEGLVRLNYLHDLRIGSENLTDSGARKLCGIVSLRNFAVTPEAVQVTDAAFADLWRLVNLHSLGVAAPKFTGRGLATLEELPALEWLSLSGPGIADVALRHAAESASLKQLTVGDWQGEGSPRLTDVGILRLVEARSLAMFNLFRRETKVTDDGLAELRRRLPNLTINAHGP